MILNLGVRGVGLGVAQLGLLLHGSMSKFQSFLPSDSAIDSRAFSNYTIKSYQLSTETSSKQQSHVIKYIYTEFQYKQKNTRYLN
jgi:hypothetical protein